MMLDALKSELNKRQALIGPMSSAITKIAESITATTVPERMKQTIAVSEMMLYASQFRRPIHHWDGSFVPINAITLIIAGSGVGKDSSVGAARKCFEASYKVLEAHRKNIAKQKAIQTARENKDPDPTSWETYKEYYQEVKPLFSAPSTPEGFIQHLNDLEVEGIGAGYIYSGEIGSELSTNPLMIDNIRAVSEMYDLGNKEVKLVKARENQSKEVKGMPVNCMMMGSQANMLYNEKIKNIITVEISTKLARRMFPVFVDEAIEEPEYLDDNGNPDVLKMLEAEEALENESYRIREKISKNIEAFTEHHMPQIGVPLDVAPEVRQLFLIYKRYNSDLSETMNPMYPMAKLTRKHQQWKALKLAGAIAMFNNRDEIIEQDYIEAIRFCELLDQDLARFEAELLKEPYEVFADYMQANAVDGKFSLGLHKLRKMKYIPMSGNPSAKMQELCHLANAYNPDGVYSADTTGVSFEAVVKTDTIGISFKPINNSAIVSAITKAKSEGRLPSDCLVLREAKADIAKTTAYGLDVQETTFDKLDRLLQGDFAYSPFRFQNGTRGKDYILGGTKWVVLDVDSSNISAEECHFMLQDINHYIALSSDPDNHFKFRVLLELDSPVETDGATWKKFYGAIADELSIDVDPVPQAQIFYSYADHKIWSTLDAEPLPAKPYLVKAQEQIAANPPQSKKNLTAAQKKALLSDEMTTFAPAFEASNGEGSRKLIWAANYAYKDLGLSKDDTIALLSRINAYWSHPLPDERLETTILSQVRRW